MDFQRGRGTTVHWDTSFEFERIFKIKIAVDGREKEISFDCRVEFYNVSECQLIHAVNRVQEELLVRILVCPWQWKALRHPDSSRGLFITPFVRAVERWQNKLRDTLAKLCQLALLFVPLFMALRVCVFVCVSVHKYVTLFTQASRMNYLRLYKVTHPNKTSASQTRALLCVSYASQLSCNCLSFVSLLLANITGCRHLWC